MKDLAWIMLFELLYKQHYGEDSITQSFLMAMSKGLQKDFFEKIGVRIKSSRGKIVLSMAPFGIYHVTPPRLQGEITGAKIAVGHDSTIVTIKWMQQHGEAISPADEVKEGDGLTFGFENLNVKKIMADIASYKMNPLESIAKKFTFKLEATTFHWDGANVLIELKEASSTGATAVDECLADFIGTWNSESEAMERRKGLIHNSRRLKKSRDKKLSYYIDFGSADFMALTNMLAALDKLNLIEKVQFS